MIKRNGVLDPRRRMGTLDVYWSKSRIVNALKSQLPNFSGTLLDVGCGRMPYKPLILSAPSKVTQYIGMDLRANLRQPAYAALPPVDLEWDGSTIPLGTGTIDCALATEIFQYFFDLEAMMEELCRVLKPGGVFFFTVPFLWPLHDSPYDQFRYTPFALDRLLRQAGFGEITLESLGGWDASLAQLIGLWVRRRPRKIKGMRLLLSLCAFPLISFLQSRDKPGPIFADQQMITGIAGTARKPGALP